MASAVRRARLRYDPSLCRPHRDRRGGCQACVGACAAKALSFERGSISLSSACDGCGLCAAACSIGALSADFTIDFISPADKKAPLLVDCQRVPEENASSLGMQVPCLGGMSPTFLMELRQAAEERPIMLLDRGWCGGCSSWKRSGHPAVKTERAVSALFEEMGLPEELTPKLVSAPLPARLQASADMPASSSRRGLLGWFTSTPVAVEIVDSPGRASLVEATEILAHRHGRPVPASLFPALVISDSCDNHGVCAALCQARALSSYQREGVSGVEFLSAKCVSCGNCVEYCPNHAISLGKSGGNSSRVPVRLTSFAVRECFKCGAEFADSSRDDFCPRCRIKQDYFTAPGAVGLERSQFHHRERSA
jgi:Fe-S-cluster-containing hydrogenase component 2